MKEIEYKIVAAQLHLKELDKERDNPTMLTPEMLERLSLFHKFTIEIYAALLPEIAYVLGPNFIICKN